MTEQTNEIRDICIRLLAQREHSKRELSDKLRLRGFDRNDVLPVIDALAEQGWQDDFRYAESYARSRIQKGYGPVRVGYELMQNGISEFDLGPLVQEIDGSWENLLERVYCKKFRGEQKLTRNEWAKRSRFLLQRGFSHAMISALFDRLAIKLL